ncbi:MAG: hypothetical protein WC467_04630 [Patescibacteria group bacterium]
MKKISKHLIAFAIISFLVLPVFAVPALAQTAEQNTLFGIDAVHNGIGTGLAQGDPREIIGRIINFALGFLGVIAVGLILFGGFKWMTAAGNEDKVSEAKQLLGAGVIGLIIILAAWAIATFIITQIYGATMNTTGN